MREGAERPKECEPEHPTINHVQPKKSESAGGTSHRNMHTRRSKRGGEGKEQQSREGAGGRTAGAAENALWITDVVIVLISIGEI